MYESVPYLTGLYIDVPHMEQSLHHHLLCFVLNGTQGCQHHRGVASCDTNKIVINGFSETTVIISLQQKHEIKFIWKN